jgi:hypothetical protein
MKRQCVYAAEMDESCFLDRRKVAAAAFAVGVLPTMMITADEPLPRKSEMFRSAMRSGWQSQRIVVAASTAERGRFLVEQ